MSESEPNKTDKLFFTYDDLFVLLKQRTQLRARGLPVDSPLTETIMVTESDKEVVESLFEEGVDDLRNKTGTFGQIKNYGGTLKYTLTENQTEEGFKEAKGLVEKALLQYLLWAWYESIGAGEFARYAVAKYERYIHDINTVSTQKAAVTPTYRPYF